MQVNGKGGLVREFINLLRNKYDQDYEFKSLIDGLSEQRLVDTANWIVSEGKAHGDTLVEQLSPLLIEELFDRDLVLSIKDRITAPVYHEHSEEDLVDWMSGHGFTPGREVDPLPAVQERSEVLEPAVPRLR